MKKDLTVNEVYFQEVCLKHADILSEFDTSGLLIIAEKCAGNPEKLDSMLTAVTEETRKMGLSYEYFKLSLDKGE